MAKGAQNQASTHELAVLMYICFPAPKSPDFCLEVILINRFSILTYMYDLGILTVHFHYNLYNMYVHLSEKLL